MCSVVETSSEIIARHLVIEGRVQGVGFRYNAVKEAQRRCVVGWVRNCSDGAVEIWLQGEVPDVEALIQWCRRGPAAADVTGLVISDREVDGTLRDFKIGQ